MPDLELWDAWHPAFAAGRLADLDVPWYVAAGWALDLLRGRQTREHEDLEIAVRRNGVETSYRRSPTYKAKHAGREKNEADFAAVRSLLNPEQRAWLVDALALVHPGHRWLRALRWPRRPGSPGRGRTGHMPRNAAAARRTRAGRAR